MVDTAHWHWPQFTLLVMLFLSFVIFAHHHGEPRLETSGPRKGEPERYNAFMKLAAIVLLLAILAEGGFFR